MKFVGLRVCAVVASVVVVLAGLSLVRAGDEAEQPVTPTPAPTLTGKPMTLSRSVTHMLAERIARQVIEASPLADPASAAARDEAAERLARCSDLIGAAPGKILWGGFHPQQGYDPRAYRLNESSPLDFYQLSEFNPVVWAKLYLSTFMFTGTYEITEQGDFTVLALDCQFRRGLDPGEYPYPFWHSPNKWTAYVHAEQVLMIFETGRLVASMRRSPPPESLRLVKRRWDAEWTWTDAAGNPQPRVALFSYLFSPDNPHIAELDASYRALEEQFRANNCITCHAPDNRGKINDLLLLNYPNQSLIMRRTLVTVLEANEMPPGDPIAGEPKGIQDRRVHRTLIELARDFERKADAAFAFEQSRRAEE